MEDSAWKESQKFQTRTGKLIREAFIDLEVEGNIEFDTETEMQAISCSFVKGDNLSIFPDPSPNTIFGTRLSFYISTFIKRTQLFNKWFVDYSLIQRAVDSMNGISRRVPINQQLKNEAASKSGTFIEETSSAAYTLAVAAIGALQCGDFNPKRVQTWYRHMHRALKPCYEEERAEVIHAHIVIAFFCKVTSLKHEFIKHSGYARVLLGCLDCNAPAYVHSKKAFSFVTFGALLTNSTLPHFQMEALKYVQCRYFETQEDFFGRFPKLNTCIELFHGQNVFHAQGIDPEFQDAAKQFFETEGTVPFTLLCVITSNIFQKAIVDARLSKESILKLFDEINFMMKLMGDSFRSAFPNQILPPLVVGYLNLIKIFRLILMRNFFEARSMLHSTVNSIDIYQMCCFFPVMEHNMHFLAIALAFLGMDEEFVGFRRKLSLASGITKRADLWPKHLSQITPDIFNSVCENLECGVLWDRLKVLCFDTPDDISV